jgi:hypothetical protein
MDETLELQSRSFKRQFYYVLAGSVGVTALLGILAILSGRFGWFEIRVLLTTVTVAVASICGLACSAYLASGRAQILPIAGIALTLIAAVMIVMEIWVGVDSQMFTKLAASCAVFAVACAHLSLLSMARLADWFRWSLTAAHVVILGVASMIVLIILLEEHSSGMFQLLGVAAIIDAAITVIIPIFHRLSRDEMAAQLEPPPFDPVNDAECELKMLKARIAELERKTKKQ